jgi:flagellar basal body rod protein FlgG
MNDLYGIARIGFDQGRERLEAIGLNASNAARPGYRRQFALDAASAPEAPAGVGARSRSDAAAAGGPVDLRPGAPMGTGRALDLAIEDEELFFALTDGERTWLTRAASFRLDAEGVLVGERGLRVVGRDGEIRLDGEDLEIRRDGQILRDGVVVGALQLFRANDRASLRSAGGALLSAGSGEHAVEAGTGRVRSGFLEGSNVEPARDVVELVALTRQFESLARVTQGYDELLGRAIQQLGAV